MEFELLMNIEEAQVLVEFKWYGTYEDNEPDWETMKVWAKLKNSKGTSDWVEVNDLLSQDQWNIIESEIYLREDELHKQAIENEY